VALKKISRLLPEDGSRNNMILADTSVWINHFHKNNPRLVDKLDIGAVVCHQFIIGELACGYIHNRKEVLTLFNALPSSPLITEDEFHEFIESRELAGKGLSFVDIHLLASALLGRVLLWTEDKILAKAAEELGVRYNSE